MMHKAILIHNPTAGNQEHSKNQLKKLIRSGGYKVKYFSTDVAGWEAFVRHMAEIIFVAGGDGTVQKVAKVLLEKGGKMQHIPVQILPLGTANNIAETLGINYGIENLLHCSKVKGFDIGELRGPGEAEFFIEGTGFGVFPKLVRQMNSREEKEGEIEEPANELRLSLEKLLEIAEAYEACEAIIIADKEEIAGKFLLVELMNIRYIGPNFELAPPAETGDGKFELVMVREDAREDLKSYIQSLMEHRNFPKTIEDFADLRKVGEVRFKWKGDDAHIDDEIIEDFNGEEIVVKNRQEVFIFLH